MNRLLCFLLAAAWLGASVRVTARGLEEPAPVPPVLSERVTAFMTAWQQRDLPTMYGFYCEAYRLKISRLEYLKLTRLVRFPILEFRVTAADLAGDKAAVTVWRKADAIGMPVGQFDSYSQQVWLRAADGSWCKEDESVLLPFPGPGGE